MRSDASDDYDFYPCIVDDAPASIYLDLRYEADAPLAGASTCYWVVITMREAGTLGIGTADEATAANAIEEAAIERGEELGLVYVGRLRTRGTWEVTLYGARGHDEALREITTQLAGGRRVEVRALPDPDWSYYRELLLPDAERRRWMDDRRVVQVLLEQGDVLARPRRVDHTLHFGDVLARDAFVSAVVHDGFTAAPSNDADVVSALVSRTDPVELDHIHEVVMTLVDAAAKHGGTYRRWTTSIERG